MKKMHGRENDSVKVVDQPEKTDVAMREEAMLAFWQEHDIFKKSLETPAGSEPVGDFVFYDGPPFANGLPHYGHILAGTIKDTVARFWTMQGHRVRRQWGWDCHGLPVENLIEKELGLATKKDIEDFGIKEFNERARKSVMHFADDWRKIVPRMGRFVDMENDYRTMDATYTESVWWVFKSLFDKGLVTEGFKSMHLCPRCGTTLSNFEVNQGYKDIKDISVYVKLKLHPGQKYGDGYETQNSAYLIVWTTTPWTLPGNMAAAVHEDGEYVAVRIDSVKELLILSKASYQRVLDGHEIEIVHDDVKGKDLVGLKYDPPFDYLTNQDMRPKGTSNASDEGADGKENAWTVYHADYVEFGEEGSGAVHLAPAFGEDDMVLAQSHGVPIFHHVDLTGRFKDFVTEFAGLVVKPKDDDSAEISHLDTDIEIVKALKANGTLLKKENITHSYPHCWRCEAPLLNYATTSWFIDVPSIKDRLVAENKQVHWVPGHVGKNRFGKWLEGARDWAISRQRYWGAPLPIWKNPETDTPVVLGSLEDLKNHVPKSGNQYFVMRHGQSESNVKRIISANVENDDPVTDEGKQQVQKTAGELQEKGIDLIIVSPFMRTKQTAEIMRTALGLSEDAVVFDDRIREYDLDDSYEGKVWRTNYSKENFATWEERFTKVVPNSENRRDVMKRMGEFLYDIEATYKDKKILIVSHGGPIASLRAAAAGWSIEQQKVDYDSARYFDNAEWEEIDFVPLPHNDHYELDFHRPYIDDIDLYQDGVKLERIPDVFDCWFESGSMPYAQFHYPFSCDEKKFQEEHFPANFIAESVDQTRGWFYSLIVLGVALFDKAPFENVVTNGIVLAEDGRKMSKSLRNYPDPMELADRTGIDAMRYYLLSSPIIRGEDLNFSEKEVQELQRKNIGRLHNVLAMYEMFADGTSASADSTNVLDAWVLTRLHQTVADCADGYKNYELDKATRPLTDFIDDLSVWYLRRSRDRLKGVDQADKQATLATLRYVLRQLSLVMAPVMPFYSEYLWQAVKEADDAESVHLAKWPETGAVDESKLTAMHTAREVVTAALEARTKAQIKVRQPIASVTGPELSEALQQVVLEELNAKTYGLAETVGIDTKLTPELLAEGAVRELMRAVQGARKEANLEPADRITLTLATDESGKAAIEANHELLVSTVGADTVQFAATEGTALTAGDYVFTFNVTKV